MAEVDTPASSIEVVEEAAPETASSTKSDDDVELLTGSVCEIKSLVEKPKGGETVVVSTAAGDDFLKFAAEASGRD